jgi:hypothetical protein
MVSGIWFVVSGSLFYGKVSFWITDLANENQKPKTRNQKLFFRRGRGLRIEEGFVQFDRALEIAFVDHHYYLLRKAAGDDGELSAFDERANPVLIERLGNHLGFGAALERLKRDGRAFTRIVNLVLRCECRDQRNVAIGAYCYAGSIFGFAIRAKRHLFFSIRVAVFAARLMALSRHDKFRLAQEQ